MPPFDPVDFRASVRSLADGSGVATPVTAAEVKELLQSFSDVREDAATRDWLRTEYPELYGWLKQLPDDVLMKGTRDAKALDAAAGTLASKINEHRDHEGWAALGLSPSYDGRAAAFCSRPDWHFLKDVPTANGVQRRFVMPEESFRGLLPLAGTGWTDRIGNRDLTDELRIRLLELGVPPADIEIEHHSIPRPWRLSEHCLCLKPEHAALLLDGVSLEPRARELNPAPDWYPVRWASLHGEAPAPHLALPYEALAKLRGVRYGLPDGAGPDEILARCKERLAARGLTNATIERLSVDGVDTIAMPAAVGRLLLAPIADGDPAAELSLKRQEGYDPYSTCYHHETAVFCAQCAKLSYESLPEIQKYAAAWGLEQPTLVDNPATDAQALVAYDRAKNTVIVSFRGSSSGKDVLADLDARTMPGPDGVGKVHLGFYNQLQSIVDAIEKAVAKVTSDCSTPPKMLIAGHSLGGALAAMYGEVALRHLHQVTAIYTFAQPKVGDAGYAEWLAERYGKASCNLYRVVNNNDPIPHTPPGWTHGDLGQQVFIDHLGKLHRPEDRQDAPTLFTTMKNALGTLIKRCRLDPLANPLEQHRCNYYLGLLRKNRQG